MTNPLIYCAAARAKKRSGIFGESRLVTHMNITVPLHLHNIVAVAAAHITPSERLKNAALSVRTPEPRSSKSGRTAESTGKSA